jgi:hypothetical protein
MTTKARGANWSQTRGAVYRRAVRLASARAALSRWRGCAVAFFWGGGGCCRVRPGVGIGRAMDGGARGCTWGAAAPPEWVPVQCLQGRPLILRARRGSSFLATVPAALCAFGVRL